MQRITCSSLANPVDRIAIEIISTPGVEVFYEHIIGGLHQLPNKGRGLQPQYLKIHVLHDGSNTQLGHRHV